MSLNTPNLNLARVVLRPLRVADATNLHALLSEEAVWRAFHHAGPPSLGAIRQGLPGMIVGYSSHDGQMHHLNLAVADRDTDELIGLIGLDTVGDGGDVRIAIQEGRRCNGLGKEALAGLLDWIRDSTQLSEVLGATDPDNAASAGLMLSVGMEETFENAQDLEGAEVPARTFRWCRSEAQ